ncbi:hypothetical protein M427DRAFT_447356 [Gonapodya prolifera JEL478]|uniref:FAD-binding domain-containing protein n=1 Tax=Gonapodya prolifera (strain JEL478) TaxID=1344416 RepID=A0A139A422_GONPJ|nr:hypothetical protein M427DRAFT_447356 [Gonapodya prolifera JEL478]|eukprot:KXS11113.1 hypothetical protein M427DRAFT_447356 [Gonapodya prolifera JEL478]
MPNQSTSSEPHPFWDIGGTIDLCPNGSYALDRLDRDLLNDVLLNTAGTSKAFYMTLMDGSDKIRQQYVAHDGEHSKDIQILRSTYRRVLMSRCEKASIQLTPNKCVVDIQQNDTQVVATFSDGTTATGHFLVAADGINSKCRTIQFSKAPPVQRASVGFAGLFDLGFTPDPSIPPLRFESDEPIAYLNPMVACCVFGVNCTEENIGAWVVLMVK